MEGDARVTDWARRVMDEVDGALPPEPVMTQRHADDLKRVFGVTVHPDYFTGYATENVVPVTTAEQDATLEWIEAIHWATGEDVR